MNIAIVHYHLTRGGVTRVIANHLGALDGALRESGERWRVALVYDGQAQGWEEMAPPALEALEVSYCPVAGLGYDPDDGAVADPDGLARRVEEALAGRGFGPDDTIVHSHNHSIGKNVSLPGALRLLAERGYPLLLQIHDFAEDFRPLNYDALRRALAPESSSVLADALYPNAGHVHYAYLNRRDGAILEGAGADPGRLHFLPNPVTPVEVPEVGPARRRVYEAFDVADHERLVLYPVRGIRRKNIGEALLWSILGRADCRVVFTLPAQTSDDLTSYRMWKGFAEASGLPCLFEVGDSDRVTFPEVMAAADRILNTSLAEGFGLVFLECWLTDRLLVGRDLPEITTDFDESGLRLETVRPRLDVPLALVGDTSFREMMLATYRRTLDRYGAPWPDAAAVEHGLAAHAADGRVDFGSLDETLQRRVLERALADPAVVPRIHELNPWLAPAIGTPVASHAELIDHNAAVVRREYSLAACGHRIADLYRAVAASPRGAVSPLPHGDRVLARFLDLDRFRPLRGLE